MTKADPPGLTYHDCKPESEFAPSALLSSRHSTGKETLGFIFRFFANQHYSF